MKLVTDQRLLELHFNNIRGVKYLYLTPLFYYSILFKVAKRRDMEDKIKSGYLYDFYGELLTEHQRSVYEMSINDDLSLAEIADSLSISRQAVHDILKRCDKLLQDYESRLHLVEKFMNIRGDVIRINELTEGNPSEATLSEISRLSQLILEEL
jgi:predicted DNA-binding protein YlxM (UPF0122 family)